MNIIKKTVQIGVLLALALLVPAAPVLAQRGGFREVPTSRANPRFLGAFHDVTRDLSQSAVRVLGDGKEVALGTIVGPDGWILTKYSLLSGKPSCKLKSGSTLEARIVGVHESYDLALLKIEAADLHAVVFTDSKVAPVGSWLVSVGTGANPVAVGVMSVATRTPPPSSNRMQNRQSNSPANPPPYLGVDVESVGKAIKVLRVDDQSGAAKAGVKADDKIFEVQGSPVSDQKTLRSLLGKMKPGDQVTIKLQREGKKLELHAKLQSRGHTNGRPDQNLMGSELSEKRTGFPTYFQTDAIIKPKDCGGPICDLDGHVIGINIARAGRVESDAIPSKTIMALLPDLKSGKLSPEIPALRKKIIELKAAVRRAEENKAAVENKTEQADEGPTNPETAKAEADKKLKAVQDELAKAEKEWSDKKYR